MIPKGYKHTELGILPEDWEVVRLGEIGKFLKGSGISKDDITDEGIPCVRYGELYTTYGEKIEEVFSYTDKSKEELVISEINDVVLPSSGETAIDLASASCILKEGVAIGSDTTIIRSNQNGVFLAYCLNTVCKKQIYSIAQGSSVIHLYANYLKALKILIPPLAEQEKIAEILSTWDTQIQNYESLITEKQTLKKGLCQTLLTAKTRIKGFGGDWEVVRLGEVGKCYGGLSGKSSKDFGDFGNCWYIPYVNIFSNQIIDENKLEKVWIDTEEKQNQVVKGDILLTLSSETAKEVGICSLYSGDLKLYLNSFCFGFRIKNHEILSPLFASWLLTSQDIRKQIFRLAQGSTRYNLSKTSFLDIQIPLPPLVEQEKIAEILDGLDNEIMLLEQKLESLKSQKKGLVQKLLNGKARVGI